MVHRIEQVPLLTVLCPISIQKQNHIRKPYVFKLGNLHELRTSCAR